MIPKDIPKHFDVKIPHAAYILLQFEDCLKIYIQLKKKKVTCLTTQLNIQMIFEQLIFFKPLINIYVYLKKRCWFDAATCTYIIEWVLTSEAKLKKNSVVIWLPIVFISLQQKPPRVLISLFQSDVSFRSTKWNMPSRIVQLVLLVTKK